MNMIDYTNMKAYILLFIDKYHYKILDKSMKSSAHFWRLEILRSGCLVTAFW